MFLEGKDIHVQPLLAPCSTHQYCFLKPLLSLINITVCTQAALINQLQMAVWKMAVVTTASNLQSALLPTRQGRHKGAMSKQQAFCSFFFFKLWMSEVEILLYSVVTHLWPHGAESSGGTGSGSLTRLHEGCCVACYPTSVKHFTTIQRYLSVDLHHLSF